MTIMLYHREGDLTYEQMEHIWVEVSQGRGQHGDFLKAFANSFTRADEDNKLLLYTSSLLLIEKYKLRTYLDNYPS